MKAVLMKDFGESYIREIPEPDVDKDEIKVAVDRVQLSITECGLYKGQKLMGVDTVKDRLKRGENRLFGHEFCGTVVGTGSNIDSFSPGDRVYAPDKVKCGTCSFCQAGLESLCENAETLGTHRPGALAEYVVAPAPVFRPLPDEVSDAEATALQPLSDVLLSVYEVGVAPGDTVAVIGTGVMGYHCGQASLFQSAGEVVAIDVEERKLELAKQRGMIPVDATEEDPVEAVQRATSGKGADIVFEAVGGSQTHANEGKDPLAQAYSMVRPSGTIVQTGIIDGEITLEPRAFRAKSVNWYNPRLNMRRHSPGGDVGKLAASLVASGRLSTDEYITHELEGLDQFERAVDITINRSEHNALGPAQLVL
jgi:threonine dehydrogenase-like Zn-dependent dehydrogenase